MELELICYDCRCPLEVCGGPRVNTSEFLLRFFWSLESLSLGCVRFESVQVADSHAKIFSVASPDADLPLRTSYKSGSIRHWNNFEMVSSTDDL